MKRRAHVLHNLLSGCVQRKDYHVLAKHLPEKHEYIISGTFSSVFHIIWLTGSRDEKTDTTTEFLGSEIPHKEVKIDPIGTFKKSSPPRNSL